MESPPRRLFTRAALSHVERCVIRHVPQRLIEVVRVSRRTLRRGTEEWWSQCLGCERHFAGQSSRQAFVHKIPQYRKRQARMQRRPGGEAWGGVFGSGRNVNGGWWAWWWWWQSQRDTGAVPRGGRVWRGVAVGVVGGMMGGRRGRGERGREDKGWVRRCGKKRRRTQAEGGDDGLSQAAPPQRERV